MAGGASGYDSNCSSGHDTFISSGHESRACAACGGAVFTGACCASRTDRFGGACLDSVTANECSLIGGSYKGDGSTCLDADVFCGVVTEWGVCCCSSLLSIVGSISDCEHRREVDSSCAYGHQCRLFVSACDGLRGGLCCSGVSGFYSCQIGHPTDDCGEDSWHVAGSTFCNTWTLNGFCPGCHTDPSDYPSAGACYEEGTTNCETLLAPDCAGAGQVFDHDVACSETIYPGACCSGCERCIDDMPEYLCDKLPGSVWKGVNTTCAGEDCSGV